jgi:quinoprotein glucose dehydrogenase
VQRFIAITLFLTAPLSLAAQEVPAVPLPEGIAKYVDNGEHDARLKGYLTPEGIKVEIVAAAPLSAPPDTVSDAGGNAFAIAPQEKGEQRGRLMHVPKGLVSGALPALVTFRGPVAGLLSYNETQLPEMYRGVLYCGAPSLIRGLVLRQKGATFEVSHAFDLLKSTGTPVAAFQPVLGPDGAIYGVDATNNRVYRLSWSGTKDEPAIPLRGTDHWAKILKQADEELLKTLESENLSDRQQAQQELARRGAKNRPALLTLLKDFDAPLGSRSAALGALQSFWNDDVKAACIEVLGSSQPEMRRLATDALAANGQRGDQEIHDALQQIPNDGDALVRRSVFVAIGKIAAPGAGDVLVNALHFDDGKDVFLRDGLVRGFDYAGKQGIDALLAQADSGAGKELDRVLEIYPKLRSRAAAAGLPVLLKNYHVKPAQKVELILSLAQYQLDPPLSLQLLEEHLTRETTTPEEKTALVKVLGLRVDGALFVGRRFVVGQLPMAVRDEVVRALRRFADGSADAREVLQQVEKR